MDKYSIFFELVQQWLLVTKSKQNFPKHIAPNPRDNDTYLVSYPRSGNTWMRFLIASAIWPQATNRNLHQLARFVPSVNLPYDNCAMLNPFSPCNQVKQRIIKTHANYEQVRSVVKRAIYLVRDGRDVIVSYWHFRNEKDGTHWSLSEFLQRQVPYGSWQKHVMEWLHAEGIDKIVVRYEDLLSEPAVNLRKVMDFLGVYPSDKIIQDAVDRNSFRQLQALEKQGGLGLDAIKDVNFMRQGKIGGWADEFSPKDIEMFINMHGEGISELNYWFR